jgi:hypothetical protein
MSPHDLSFVIPTYRLRDVGEAVEEYDRHFWKNGHTLKLIVFDDSSPANQQKYLTIGSTNGVSARRVNRTPAIRHRGRRSEEPPRPGTAQAQG